MKKLFRSRFQLPLVFAILISAFLGGANHQRLLGVNHANFYACDGRMMTESELLTYRDISLETMEKVQAGRGLTYAELCDIPQAKLDRAIYRSNSPKPDHPGEAMEFRRMQLEDENGEIPVDAYANALARIDEMTAEQELGATGAGIENTSWNWIGPGNIGGRVRALAIHPTTPDTMWAGSVSGGIWKTINGGESWQAQDDFMANLAVTSIVIDSDDSNILYAGTGEGFWNIDAISGAWIFKTTDGGATWAKLPIVTSDPEEGVSYVNRLAISPNGDTLLAATEDGVLRSDISTNDELWVNTMTLGTRVLDVDFDPSNNSKVVASSVGKLWYSTDGGATWTSASFTGAGSDHSEEFGRIEVAYAPSASNIVYMSVITENDKAEIWKSTDGGQNYSRQSTANTYLGSQGWYDNVIWVDPTNANTIIVGGIDLWRSTDSGATLTKISQWWSAPSSAHADHHLILAHPDFNGTTNKKVYFGNDGGVYRADDVYTVAGTSGWTELNNNLGITQFYGAAGNPTTGDIIGGTQDNGTLFYGYGSGTYEKSTEGWRETYGGDGGFSAADPGDANYYYGEYVYLNIHRSDDAGYSADYISGQYWNGSAWVWKAAPYKIDDAENSTANFIAPFILDPNNSSRLLAGGLSLWKTDDVKTANTNTTGPSWAAIKSSVGSNISAIAVASGDSNTIWVGHNNGNVYKTTNGGSSWTQVDGNSVALPDRYVSRIAIDANNNDVVYVTFTGFSDQNIYKTTNGGTSWVDSSGSLPIMPIRSVVINPTNSNYLYLGTELGVFTSENAGGAWDIAQDGPANVSVDELFFLDNTTLVAATHGRGLFTAKIGGTPPTNDDFDSAVVIPADLGDPGPPAGPALPYRYPSSGDTDTTSATTAGDDPAIANCDIAPGTASVWYAYKPDENIDLSVDTKGSSYDTYLALWTGDRGNLTPVTCNDNISQTDPDSEFSLSFASGTQYYIEAGEYNGDISGASVGGNLVLNISGDVGTVSGTVTTSGGSPIEGATVTATGQSDTTDAAGEYTLFPVSADANLDADLTVSVEASGYPSDSQLIDVESGATTANVDFELGYSASFDTFDGSASINATGPIVALARPHIGNQVMTYDADALSEATDTAYVPMLFKNMWGGGYDASFYVQNIDTSDAVVDIRYFDWSGNEAVACRETITIASGASRSYWLPDMDCFGASWVGGATLVSTNGKKIIAVGRPHVNDATNSNGEQILSYNSFPSGARTMYVPMLFKNMWGGGYNAAMYIQNIDTSVAADITISFFDWNGNLTCSQTDSIQPSSTKGYWIPGNVCLKNLSSWVGGAKIVSSTADIVALGRPHVEGQILSYNGLSQGGTTAYAPMQFKNAGGDGSHSTAFYVQNLASVDTTLTFYFYNPDGSEACEIEKTVVSKATRGFWLGGIEFPCLSNGWTGSLKLDSTQSMIAMSRPNRGTEIMSYNGAAAGSTKAYLPMIFRNLGNSNSGLFVQNVDPNNSTDIEILFHTTTDGYACRLTATLNPMERKEYWFGSGDSIVCD